MRVFSPLVLAVFIKMISKINQSKKSLMTFIFRPIQRNFSIDKEPSLNSENSPINCRDYDIISARINNPLHTRVFMRHIPHPNNISSINNNNNGSSLSTKTFTNPPIKNKRMEDSFCEIILPITQSSTLLEAYQSIHGGLRFGRLMEDMDALASLVAYKHCNNNENLDDNFDYSRFTLVTAAVDRVDLLRTFGKISNVRLRGFVTYTGRSSMEITLSMELSSFHQLSHHHQSMQNEQWDLAAMAKFVFVARSPDMKHAIPINRLVAETDSERELIRLGQLRHEYRLRRSEQSLFKSPPTEPESRLLHSLLIGGGDNKVTEGSSIPMKKTELFNLRIAQPQDRNIHNFIFGGYLMREAFELAYATAIMFTQGREVLITTVDDVNFVHPVPIGSLLDFNARIAYTDTIGKDTIAEAISTDVDTQESQNIHSMTKLYQRIHVQVIADVLTPSTGARQTTNTFHYTFISAIPPSASSSSIKSVIPETYLEAMHYLEGKRRIEIS